jgi:predicted Rossmann-fold nucleotide-binding protein
VRKERLVNTLNDFISLDKIDPTYEDLTLQNIDFSDHHVDWTDYKICTITFLGCTLTKEEESLLIKNGAIILPDYNEHPYNPYRSALYTWQELEAEADNGRTVDLNIYEHFYDSRFSASINESLWQRIHDHAIDTSLRQLIKPKYNGDFGEKIVGFMGGHGTLRTDPFYAKTAFTAKAIAEKGYFVASGGGPGIMEATNLGAYFAKRPARDLLEAIKMLSIAPYFSDDGFMDIAKQVLIRFPDGTESLAIPTWFYGHEPSNVFASHIAKYFSNSIREDTLLAICLHGIVYAPGSAGTTQEIFMDAAQNHYGTYGYLSPMVFLGKKRYEIETMLFPMIKQLAKDKEYGKMLFLADDPEAIVNFIDRNPPRKVK